MVTQDTYPKSHYEEVHVVGNRFPGRRISWSAVFAGVIISIVIYALLELLGVAVGASTVDPLKEQNPVDGLGMGAAIWTCISMMISAAAGGYLTGRLSPREGALHGLLMFGVNTIIFLVLMTMLANSVVSGTMNVVGAGLRTVGASVGAVMPHATQAVKEQMDENGINLDDLKNELTTTLRQTGKPELQPERLEQRAENEVDNAQQQAAAAGDRSQTADQDITGFINGLISRNQDTFQAADREALKNIIKARTGQTDAQAEQTVNDAEKTYQAAREKYNDLKKQAEQTAREAGEKAAAATAKMAWFSFFLLIIEAILATVMGKVGRRSQPLPAVTMERTDRL
ncbi:hypothetical protein J0B02_14505 [Enterobacteriaceae bacterium YMB-R22]|jgi:hypothetical protein|uniref:YrzE family protein n=1 Tax=Tenebrionicola larvae TaxID=2815733 RepID=UPI002010E824|nr:YrzE family protein [Tenebrionicola larvae]MBV4414009.1 hypothetical protein [Tenebrionicola larvae]